MAQGIKGSQGVCGTEGCERPTRRRGLCNRCSQRFRKAFPDDAARRLTPEERFFDKVARPANPDACWLWKGSLIRATGYGSFYLDGMVQLAHRASYQMFVGPITGETLDHICHSDDPSCPGGPCEHRRCVNPRHLEQTSFAENVERGRGSAGRDTKERAQFQCRNGHAFTLENTRTRVRLDGGVRRTCRTCERIARKARDARDRSTDAVR